MVTPRTPDPTTPMAADDGSVSEMAGTPGVGATTGAVAGVLLLVALGALVGWGIVDTDCSGECTNAAIWGGLVGAAAGAIGAAILAVLVLRARFLWRVPHDQDQDQDPDADLQPGESLRNGSA